MKNLNEVIISPVITEKAMSASTAGQYVFRVSKLANKIEIRNAVERLYKVKVVQVNTTKIRGKERRTGWTKGRTSSSKKAYVTLAAGSVIEEIKA